MDNETNVVYRQIEFAPVLEKVKKLQSDRKYRDRQKLFFAEGIRNFVEAIDHKIIPETIIYSEKLLISPVARKLVRQLKRDGVSFTRATPEQFRAISKTERASGVAAIFRQSFEKLECLNPAEHICWTALSHIRSQGNLGTLIRTSAAIGAGGFILIGDHIDPFDPNVVRATMGAIFRQKMIRTDFKRFGKWIRTSGLQVVGASPSGLLDYDKAHYPQPTVLMLGNERAGLTDDEKRICRQIVRIPMMEDMDSLNVAVAGSLLLYEVFRASRHWQRE